MNILNHKLCLSLFLTLMSTMVLRAGPDGLNMRSSENVRLEMIFACGGDDAMCIKARDTRTSNPDYDVRNIITSNVMIYQDGFRATKIGTETDAAFMEDILYENIFVVSAGSANTLFLTDTAVVRNVLYKNFYVEGGGGNFGVGTQTFAGRTPTGYAEAITVSNLVTAGTLRFYGHSASTATRDSEAVNYRRRSTGALYTDAAVITGPNASNISISTNPVIAQEMVFPIEGSRHRSGNSVYLEASAIHEEGAPLTVTFLNHGEVIGTATEAPYTLLWEAPDGRHSVTFTVTDGLNQDELHAPRRFEVRSEPVFSSVEINPIAQDIGPSLSRPFDARALDQFGELLDPQPANWTWSIDGGGTVDSSGVVKASSTRGGPYSIRAETTISGTTLAGQGTFVVTDVLEITDMIVSTGKAYEWATLQSGERRYIDRETTFANVPEALVGRFFLRNSNSDKNVSGTVVSFEINLPTLVYVAVTSDFDRTQDWFAGFEDTGLFLSGNRVYARLFDAGRVVLGRNGTSDMYHVVLNYPDTANSAPVAAFTAEPLAGRAPLTVTFDANASSDLDQDIVQYDWDFGDGTVLQDGGPAPTHTYKTGGTYTVTLTVVDEHGAQDTEAKTDFIFVGDLPPVASFEVSPDKPDASVAVSFDAGRSSDLDGTVASYHWDFGDGETLSNAEAVVSHTYTTSGAFNVTLTVTDDGGQTGSMSQVVFVGNQPPFAALESNRSTGLSPFTVSFDARGSSDPDNDPLTYLWDFGDGATDSTSTPQTQHTFVEAGSYTVTVEVSDGTLSDTATVLISVVAAGTANLIYHFDFDNNDGAGTTVDDVSGFGTAAHATTYNGNPPSPASLFTASGPGTGLGGNFSSSRTNMVFNGDKFEERVTDDTGAFTFVWTMRLNGFGGGGNDADRAFLEDTRGGLRIGGTGEASGGSVVLRLTLGETKLNARTLDASQPTVIAVTMSEESNEYVVYAGPTYRALAEHDRISTTANIPAISNLRVGDTSARDPDMFIDDIRIYDEALTLPEIQAIADEGLPPQPLVVRFARASTPQGEPEALSLSLFSEVGKVYQLRGAPGLGDDPVGDWQALSEAIVGDGSTINFDLSMIDESVERFFFVIEVSED